MHLAAMYNHPSCIEALLKHQSDAMAIPNNTHMTPLQVSIYTTTAESTGVIKFIENFRYIRIEFNVVFLVSFTDISYSTEPRMCGNTFKIWGRPFNCKWKRRNYDAHGLQSHIIQVYNLRCIYFLKV